MTVQIMISMQEQSQDWLERIVMGTFTDKNQCVNQCMYGEIFVYVSMRLGLFRRDTCCLAILLENKVTVSIWYLARG